MPTKEDNPIGIVEIGIYIPEKREANADKKALFQIDDEFLSTKIGVDFVSRRNEGEETSAMCVQAFANLARKCPIDAQRVDCIIVITQNPDGQGIPHTSAIVHGLLGCKDRCAAFDIALGCSGYVYGLSIAQSFMEKNRLEYGLLFTADPYSKIVDPLDKNTALLFGDAATVTLLARNAVLTLGGFTFASRGSGRDSLKTENSVLKMNGRAVFNFSAVEVPAQVRELLAQNNLGIDEVDVFLLHQASRYLLDTIERRLGVGSGKIPSNLRHQGNTVSSSIPNLLAEYLHNRNLRRMVISGFGVGLSWASGLLARSGRD